MVTPYSKSQLYREQFRYREYGPDANGDESWGPDQLTTVSNLGFDASGSYNPSWRSQVRNFSDAGTGYSATYYTVQATPSTSCEGKRKNNSYPGKPPNWIATTRCQGQLVDAVVRATPTSSLDSQVTNLAKTRIVRKINEFTRPLQGGVLLGELRETLRMIRNPLLGLRRGLDTYLEFASQRARRVRISDAVKRRRARERILSDVWLEYSFGWKPLLSDIDSLCDAIARNNYYAANRAVLRSSADARTQDDTSFVLNGQTEYSMGGVYVYRVTRTSVTETRCRIVVGVEVSRSSSSTFDRSLFGFGTWREFVPTVWELIPYSFLVDYFTNVGDVLESYAVMPGAVKWSSRTINRTRTYTQSGVPDLTRTAQNLGSNFVSISGSPGALVCKVKVISRASLGTSLWIRPEIRNNLSWLKGLNLLALADKHRHTRLRLSN